LIFEYKLENAPGAPSIGGGGRYDGLTMVYNGPFEYSTGLALGIDRIALALSGRELPRTYRKIAILVIGNAPLVIGYKILDRIVKTNRGVTGFVLKTKSLPKSLEYAGKIGVDYTVIIGEREYREGVVALKDMKTGEQVKLSIDELINRFSQ